MLLVLMALACAAPATPESVRCPEGELDDQGRCVPVDCGRGTWGNLDLGEETIYVDAEADDDGAGGEGDPLRTLAEGLAMAGELGWSTVAVAEGVYEENLEIDATLSGLHLAGRCAELVVLEAGEDESGLDVGARRGGPERFTLSGFTVRGGDVGMELRHGATRVSTSRIEGSHGVGLYVLGEEVTVIVEDSSLTGARRYADGSGGGAMQVEEGARAHLARVTVEGTESMGLYAEDAVLSLEDVSIAGAGDDKALVGPLIQLEKATLVCRSCVLAEGLGVGVFMSGSVASLEDSLVERTRLTLDAGYGVVTEAALDGSPSRLVLDGTTIADVPSSGIWAEGASLLLERSSILDVGEIGVGATGGAEVEVEDLLIDGAPMPGFGLLEATLGGNGLEIANTAAIGLEVSDGVIAGLKDLHIHDLQIASEHTELGALGIVMSDGSRGVIEDLLIEDAYGAGVQVDSDSVLTLVDAQILRTHPSPLLSVAYGLNAFDGGVIDGESVRVHETEGVGVYVVVGSFLCTDCAITDSAYAGVALLGQGRLRLDGDGSSCEISGTDESPSFGVGIGLVADTMGFDSSLKVEVDGCVIQHNATAGLYLAGTGAYFIQDSQIEGGEAPLVGVYPEGNAIVAHGVSAWDAEIGSGFWLQGTSLHDAAGSALLLHDAGVTLGEGVRWSDNALDVLQQGCAGGEPSLICPEGATCELCPTYDHRFEPIDFYLNSPELELDE